MINLCMEGCSQAGWFSCLDVNPILAKTHSNAVKAVPLKQGLQSYSFISQKSRVFSAIPIKHDQSGFYTPISESKIP